MLGIVEKLLENAAVSKFSAPPAGPLRPRGPNMFETVFTIVVAPRKPKRKGCENLLRCHFLMGVLLCRLAYAVHCYAYPSGSLCLCWRGLRATCGLAWVVLWAPGVGMVDFVGPWRGLGGLLGPLAWAWWTSWAPGVGMVHALVLGAPGVGLWCCWWWRPAPSSAPRLSIWARLGFLFPPAVLCVSRVRGLHERSRR